MSIKSDRWIRRMAQEHDMINPYSEKQVSAGVISYGVSSYGYDLRVADEFKIFTNVNSTIVDPKHFDERSFVTVNADVAHRAAEFVCAGALGRVLQDSARCAYASAWASRPTRGAASSSTSRRSSRSGKASSRSRFRTLRPLPAKIYANEGLCQILFFQSDEVCETSYKDRKGKYQAQKGIVLPKL